MEWEYVEKPTEWLSTDTRKNKGAQSASGGLPGVTEGKPFTHEHHVAAT
jgi:hypothetical protein